MEGAPVFRYTQQCKNNDGEFLYIWKNFKGLRREFDKLRQTILKNLINPPTISIAFNELRISTKSIGTSEFLLVSIELNEFQRATLTCIFPIAILFVTYDSAFVCFLRQVYYLLCAIMCGYVFVRPYRFFDKSTPTI